MRVKRELEGGWFQWLAMPLPALLTIQTGGNRPRYATMRMIKQAKQKTIDVLDGASVGLDQAGARVAWAHWPAGLAAWRLGRFDEAGRHFKTLARADRLTP